MPLLVGARRGLLSAGLAYYQRVLKLGPIAYWPLWEASGSVAECLVNSAQNGTYVNAPTLGQPGIGDGRACPLFDGVDQYVNIYSAALNSVWNGQEFTVVAWAKVSAAGVWTDGAWGRIVAIGASSSNLVTISKSLANNRLDFDFLGGGVYDSGVHTTSETGWLPVAITVSDGDDRIDYWVDGVSVGNDSGVGTWAGALHATLCCIGAKNTAAADPFSGYVAHVALFDRVLVGGQVRSLAVV